jgi:NAD(P)-dependent dehydrogenase (short-subunit alcohol dehydrogenase family)
MAMRTLARKALLYGAGAVAGYALTQALVRRARRIDFQGKVAIVAGGSRGLGLVLSRQLVARGAKVAVCARTEEDVRAVLEELRSRGGEVMGAVCDITRQDDVNSFVEQVADQFGKIDLLFNVAGIIQVGPLDTMTLEDFHQAMDVNCFGPLHMILSVLPHMRRRRFGRIVNVASIGGKKAVPHLLPYDASKFALVGLSTGLRTELAEDGILVTTANPTLMRTGSPRNAMFKGRHREEYAWFSVGDALPIISMSAERAANQILRACQHGDAEVFITNLLNPAVIATKLAPALTTEVLAIVNRFLPSAGGIGQRTKRGYESQSAVSPSPLTALGEQAARRNNEMRPRRE